MKGYLFGDEEYIKLTDLIDFASKEDNNKIIINGRMYTSPICCKDCKHGSIDIYDDSNVMPIWCAYCNDYKNETDFCSRGAKRDE